MIGSPLLDRGAGISGTRTKVGTGNRAERSVCGRTVRVFVTFQPSTREGKWESCGRKSGVVGGPSTVFWTGVVGGVGE